MSSMTGKYKLKISEEFCEYLKSIGLSANISKAATSVTPVINITKEEDEWTIKTSTPAKTTEIKFKLGEEFYETTNSGRICKSIITQEGDNKLVQLQKCIRTNRNPKIVREFTDTEMRVTYELGTESSTRVYRKQ